MLDTISMICYHTITRTEQQQATGREGKKMKKEYVATYALDKAKSILNDDMMDDRHKVHFTRLILRTLELYQAGTITTDEAMLLIAK